MKIENVGKMAAVFLGLVLFAQPLILGIQTFSHWWNEPSKTKVEDDSGQQNITPPAKLENTIQPGTSYKFPTNRRPFKWDSDGTAAIRIWKGQFKRSIYDESNTWTLDCPEVNHSLSDTYARETDYLEVYVEEYTKGFLGMGKVKRNPVTYTVTFKD